MTGRPLAKRDLVVLTADKTMEYSIRSILQRHASLGVRPLDFLVRPYPGGFDPGCYLRSHDILRRFLTEFAHALVVFDHQGSGQESRDVKEVEREVEDRLRLSGWEDRAAVVVIVPQLEAWVWGPSRQVEEALGWLGQPVALREWLRVENLWPEADTKPPDPEAAVDATLRRLGRSRSASLYARLAQRVSLRRCEDRSFQRLVQILRSWFPAYRSPQ